MPERDPITSSSTRRSTLTSSAPAREKPRRPPNVLFIQIDDVGPEQLAHYDDCNQWAPGYFYAPTPALDALAARGMRFRRAYSLPSCSPTKAATVTGYGPEKTGVSGLIKDDDAGTHKLAETWDTAPKLGKGRGSIYSYLHAGKYHLGWGRYDTDPILPTLGVDRFIGCPVNLYKEGNTGFGAGTVDQSGQPSVWFEYDSLTDSETDQSAEYNPDRERATIESWIGAQDGPWCVSWWLHSPHAPYHWPPGSFHTYGAEPAPPEALRLFQAMTEAADTCIGDLVDYLDSTGQLEDTVIIFTTDNGTPGIMVDANYAGHNLYPPPDVYNGEHFKFVSYEGGVHVPLLISGPGIPPGAVCDALVHCADFMPTVAELVGAGALLDAPSDLVGKSLVPLFTRPTDEVREFVISANWQPEGSDLSDPLMETMRLACWEASTGYKLILTSEGVGSAVVEQLYNVGADPTARIDPHEASQILPGASDESDAAFSRLANHVMTQMGFTWPTLWTIQEPTPVP